MMSWDDIVGQETVVRNLRDALRRDAITHAYLFHGPEGSGKMCAALRLSQAVICREGDGPDGMCGSCRDCLRIEEGNHPDVLAVGPGEGESSIGIDRIRELRRGVPLRPTEAEHRFVIIGDSHRMTVQAQNSLLKMLEEPPEFLSFVLITPGLRRLLPTIQSRCRVIGFARVAREAIVCALRERHPGLDGEELLVAAAAANGSLREAEERIENSDTDEEGFREQVLGLLGRLPTGNPAGALDVIEEGYELAGNRMGEFLELAGLWFRDLLLYIEAREKGEAPLEGLPVEELLRDRGVGRLLVCPDRRAQLGSVAGCYSRDDVCSLLETVEELAGYVENHVNSRLILELFIIDLEDKGK